MAKNKSLLEEAVVAAKEVREAAIQHAYRELEENLTPSIKEALAQKLEEELDVEDLEEGTGAVAGFKPVKAPKKAIKEEDNPDETEETEDKTEEEVEVTDDEKMEDPEEDENLPEDEPKEEDDKTEESEKEPSDDTELGDLTVGQLKDLIATMVSTIAPERPAEQPEDMEPANVQGQGDEETPITGDEEELKITDDETVEKDSEEKEGDDVEIDLNELLKELESEEHDRKVVTHKEDAEFQKELDEVKKERDEALQTVSEMKETLKSTNLLNAKLSYAVRLLSKPLTEGQKTRVVKAFDEAQSASEVKAVYRTLVESFNSEAKMKTGGLIKEHKGSASRAAGKSTAAPIVEVDPMVRRFQQLAGIIQ